MGLAQATDVTSDDEDDDENLKIEDEDAQHWQQYKVSPNLAMSTRMGWGSKRAKRFDADLFEYKAAVGPGDYDADAAVAFAMAMSEASPLGFARDFHICCCWGDRRLQLGSEAVVTRMFPRRRN